MHSGNEVGPHILQPLLNDAGYVPVFESTQNLDGLKQALQQSAIDMIVCEPYPAVERVVESVLEAVGQLASDAPVVVVDKEHSASRALWAIKAGANDCVPLNDTQRLSGALVRAAREALKNREADITESHIFKTYFLNLFENSSEAIAIIDPNENVIDVNQAFVDLFYYGRDELKGRRISDVIVPEGKQEEYSSLRSQVYGGRMVRRETTRHRKDGSPVRVSVIGCPIVFDEKAFGVYAIYSDITRQMKALQALRQAESNYRNFFQNALEGMYMSTPSGRFVTVNPAMAELLGYDTPNDLADTVKSIAKEVYAEPGTREDMLARLKESDRITKFHSRVKRKDGIVLAVCENILAVRDEDGDLLYYQGTMQAMEASARPESC
jgi:PAS domain S-box-containing protein